MDVGEDQLRQAIERQHGGMAKLAYLSHARDLHARELVWDGEVHVFDLQGHPKATRAYAWSSPVEGSYKRRFDAVLHLGGIRPAIDAIRAIVAQRKMSP
jgi:hypothetical protein